LTLDLGKPQLLNTMRLWPYWGDARHYQYLIEGSTDGKNWIVLVDQRKNVRAATAEGRLFRFPAQEISLVRLTFTHCSAGDIAHVVEIAGGHLDQTAAQRLVQWENMTPGLHGALGSIDTRYGRHVPPEDCNSRQWQGTAWRGERTNVQALLWTAEGARQVRVEASPLANENGGTIPAAALRRRFVRYVIAEEESQLAPDILDNADRLDLPPQTTRPVWITVDVPHKTAPGKYRGVITVKAAGQKPLTLELVLDVLGATVPSPAKWSFRLDLWQNPWAVAHHHGVEPFSDVHMAILEPHLKMLADAGQTFITTYVTHDAWGETIYHNEGTMVEWIRTPSGRWRFDYTNFDKYVEVALRCGITKAITCYTPAAWSNRYRYLDEATGEYVHVRWPPASEEYESFWLLFLKNLEEHLRARGWFERTFLGVNENPLPETQATISVIKRANPKWKITYAGNWHPELNEQLDDYCMVINHSIPAETLEERRRSGRTTTFYVCCVPPRPNNFTFSPPAESAWMGWRAAAKGYDGFLRWAYDSWTADPLHDSRHVHWPAGDCWLVYPGCRSSIRFERLREGIVDYEKLRILRAKLGELGKTAALRELDDHLSHFNFKEAQNTEAVTEHLRAAKACVCRLAREVFGH
ncbi:MAG: glycoside hydrolase domain-containing protein, partial [Planctomycetota bacterium]